MSIFIPTPHTFSLAGKLSQQDQANLVAFIAKVSEASYRRGLQQGKDAAVEGIFTASLSKSPHNSDLVSSGITSIGRLALEYDDSFNKIGLLVSIFDQPKN